MSSSFGSSNQDIDRSGKQPQNITTIQQPQDTTTIRQRRKFRKYDPKNNFSIIGLQDPSLRVIYSSSSTPATVIKQDFTTYSDKAVIQLKNETASPIVIVDGCIIGRRVLKFSGRDGYLWEYSDYDKIERDGEKFLSVESDYLTTADQCKKVGDYLWKEYQPHKVYTLSLLGCQYWMDIGDVYTLDLTYSVLSGNIESINTEVEVIAINFNRDVGDLGNTEVILRVPSPAWQLSSTTNARLIGGASASRLNNRSNVVTVASLNYAGQADYYCDGIGDENTINLAMAYVSSIGGGEVVLTSGTFIINDTINCNSNTTLTGQGNSTIFESHVSGNTILSVNNENVLLRHFLIKGGGDITMGDIVHGEDGGVECFHVNITSILDASMSVYGFVNINKLSYCNVNWMTSEAGIATAFHGCTNLLYCSATNILRGNSTIGLYGAGFVACDALNGCESLSSTDYGFSNCSSLSSCSAYNTITGFNTCYGCQQNRTSGVTNKYVSSYADSGTSYPCADTPNGGFNS